MLVYDALEGRFLTIKLRPKQQGCCVCGDNPTINKLQDYELFCGASATDKVRKLWKVSLVSRHCGATLSGKSVAHPDLELRGGLGFFEMLKQN